MRNIGTREKIAVGIVFAALVATYTYWIYFRFPIGLADSAFFAQMLDRMAQSGRPMSQVSVAINHLLSGFKPFIMTAPAQDICRLDLVGPGPGEFNFFRWHAYPALYVYLPVFKVLGGELGMSLLTATSFLMVMLGSYVLLRKHGISILVSTLVAILFIVHPAWSGGVLGQFYAERLFVGPAFILCVLLLSGQFESRWAIPLAILLALTSERAGMIVGALLIGAVFLADWQRPRVWWNRRWLLFVGLLCAATSTALIAASESPDYQHFIPSILPANFLENLREYPNFASRLLTFLEINAVAWGLPALWCWRGVVLSLGVMVPNIMGNLGGGEKNAFIAHYHSFYFPVLAATLCLSFVSLHKKYPQWASWAFIGWLVTAGLAYNFPLNAFDFQFDDIASRSLSYPFKNYASDQIPVNQREEMATYMDQFPGTMVSTNEGLMPVLSRHHRVAYYPLGIADSDFVVIPKSSTPGVYGGAFSYLGDEELQRIDECLSRRLVEDGYQIQKEFDALVVLKPKKNGPAPMELRRP